MLCSHTLQNSRNTRPCIPGTSTGPMSPCVCLSLMCRSSDIPCARALLQTSYRSCLQQLNRSVAVCADRILAPKLLITGHQTHMQQASPLFADKAVLQRNLPISHHMYRPVRKETTVGKDAAIKRDRRTAQGLPAILIKRLKRDEANEVL